MTMGMTTAMAVLPLVERPPLSSFCAFCRLVEPVFVGLALAPEPEAPFVGSAGLAVGLMTEVMVMTCGGSPEAVADVMTTTDVSIAVEGGADGAVMVLVGGALAEVGGGAEDWAGGGALDGAGAEEGGAAELCGGGAEEAGGGFDEGAGGGALEGAGAGVEGGGLEAGSGAEGELEAGGGVEGEFEAGVGASDEGCGDAAEGVTDGERGWEAGAEAEAVVRGLLAGADEGATVGLDATKEGDNVLAVTLLDMIAKIAQAGRQGTRKQERTKERLARQRDEQQGQETTGPSRLDGEGEGGYGVSGRGMGWQAASLVGDAEGVSVAQWQRGRGTGGQQRRRRRRVGSDQLSTPLVGPG